MTEHSGQTWRRRAGSWETKQGCGGLGWRLSIYVGVVTRDETEGPVFLLGTVQFRILVGDGLEGCWNKYFRTEVMDC